MRQRATETRCGTRRARAAWAPRRLTGSRSARVARVEATGPGGAPGPGGDPMLWVWHQLTRARPIPPISLARLSAPPARKLQCPRAAAGTNGCPRFGHRGQCRAAGVPMTQTMRGRLWRHVGRRTRLARHRGPSPCVPPAVFSATVAVGRRPRPGRDAGPGSRRMPDVPVRQHLEHRHLVAARRHPQRRSGWPA